MQFFWIMNRFAALKKHKRAESDWANYAQEAAGHMRLGLADLGREVRLKELATHREGEAEEGSRRLALDGWTESTCGGSGIARSFPRTGPSRGEVRLGGTGLGGTAEPWRTKAKHGRSGIRPGTVTVRTSRTRPGMDSYQAKRAQRDESQGRKQGEKKRCATGAAWVGRGPGVAGMHRTVAAILLADELRLEERLPERGGGMGPAGSVVGGTRCA